MWYQITLSFARTVLDMCEDLMEDKVVQSCT